MTRTPSQPRLADPMRPFFAYVSPNGELLTCLMGTPAAGLVSFEAFRRDVDMPVSGVWNPKEGTLALHGDDGFAEVSAVVAQGPYAVVEIDGSLTVEADGSRQLAEGELLLTQRLLDSVPAGGRIAALGLDAGHDDDDDRLRHEVDANVLGHADCTL